MLCNICPRKCNVDRKFKKGFCKASDTVKLARAALHKWEEPCISAVNGSGAVFFSGCNMQCVYCQNLEISQNCFGKEVSIYQLVDIFLSLQNQNAHNINLVTPTHFALQIVQAVHLAKSKGLTLPIVYNTSSYENSDTIKMLKATVDIFLADFKYFDDNLALKYSNSHNYFATASLALDSMVNMRPFCVFDDDNVMKSGVIVRVLVLPGQIEDSKKIIKYLYDRYKNNIFISIMNQYTPVSNLENFAELDRKLSQAEYDEVVDYAILIGVENGFIQQGGTASESFIPPFNLEGV